VPLTPEQIAKLRQKEADLPEALRRDSLTNYFEGYFFVTLNTRGEAPILSSCVGVVGGEGKDAPHCEYTELGYGVLEAWKRNQVLYQGVEVIDCEIMPEHFHGLLYLKKGNKKHLGQIINGFMIGCTHAYWDTLGIDWRAMTYTKGVRMPQYNDRDHMRSFRGPALFVRGYNDVEPITPEEVQIKIEYIHKQAEKRLIQGDNHDCFRIYRHQHSKNWTEERCMKAIAVDRTFRYDAEKCAKAQRKVLERLNADDKGATAAVMRIGLDHIGNKALLYSSKKLPLVCHSADADRFEEQMAAVIDAARKGYVIVSAFISQRERDIKAQLMVEQLPFIEIVDNGFSGRYKPSGKAFYACGESRLVQITCWNYLYLKHAPTIPGKKKVATISREMCLVMNELARVISKCEDEW